jgi:hypothetical protein
MVTKWIQMIKNAERETKKVAIMAYVKQSITNNQEQKASSTQLGIS